MEENKTYEFDCSCANCGNEFSATENYSCSRPAGVICPVCGNMARTSTKKMSVHPKHLTDENKIYLSPQS